MISIVNGVADRAKLISASVGCCRTRRMYRGLDSCPWRFFPRLSLWSLFFSRTVARRARIADDSSSNGWLLGLQRPAIS